MRGEQRSSGAAEESCSPRGLAHPDSPHAHPGRAAHVTETAGASRGLIAPRVSWRHTRSHGADGCVYGGEGRGGSGAAGAGRGPVAAGAEPGEEEGRRPDGLAPRRQAKRGEAAGAEGAEEVDDLPADSLHDDGRPRLLGIRQVLVALHDGDHPLLDARVHLGVGGVPEHDVRLDGGHPAVRGVDVLLRERVGLRRHLHRRLRPAVNLCAARRAPRSARRRRAAVPLPPPHPRAHPPALAERVRARASGRWKAWAGR